MMTNLFSLFDPSLSLFSLSWLTCIIVIFVLPNFYWIHSSFMSLLMFFLMLVKKEMDYVLKSPKKGSYALISSIFLLLVIYNFFALFPFIYSSTSHLLITLPMSYIFWFMSIMFSIYSSVKSFLSHLIPSNTPIFLMSFMVLVEVLSNFIRPLALMFRLTANMMAGHLLMSLISSGLISLSFMFLLIGSFLQFFLVLMEMGVSIIQAYVFATLLTLYISESEH